MMTVLVDKEGYDQEGIERVWKHVEKLSEMISEGIVNVADLKKVLQDEMGIYLD